MAIASKSSWAKLQQTVSSAAAANEVKECTDAAASLSERQAKPFVDVSFPPLPSSLWPRGVAPPMMLPQPPSPSPLPSRPSTSASNAATSPGCCAHTDIAGTAAVVPLPEEPSLVLLPLMFCRPNEIFDGHWSVLPEKGVEGESKSENERNVINAVEPLTKRTTSLGEVRQGLLANCWMLCALCAIAAQHPAVVEAMFFNHHDSSSSRHRQRRRRIRCGSDESSGMHRIKLYKGTVGFTVEGFLPSSLYLQVVIFKVKVE